MEAYLEPVILLNFLVDVLLLPGTGRLSGFSVSLLRTVAAALLSGVHSGVCLLPAFRFLGNPLWRTVFRLLTASVAFGWERGWGKRALIYLMMRTALGGIAVSVERSAYLPLLLGGLSVWLLYQYLSDGNAQEYIPLELTYGSNSLRLLALRDTGNTLRDPVSGEQVLVISPEAARKLTGLTSEQLRCPLETLTSRSLPGLRLVPYRTVGNGGMLLALRFPEVKLGSKRKSAVVAFAQEEFGCGSGIQALTGGTV